MCSGSIEDLNGDGHLSAAEPCVGTASAGPPIEGTDKVPAERARAAAAAALLNSSHVNALHQRLWRGRRQQLTHSTLPAAAGHQVIYPVGLQFVRMELVHAVFDPWVRDQNKHCLTPGFMWPSARVLPFCEHPLSIPIETPAKCRGGCSRMTVSRTARFLPMAPIDPASPCADWIGSEDPGGKRYRWTDGDLMSTLHHEGLVSGHGTCEDGDTMLLNHLLRASEMTAIKEAAELTGGLVLLAIGETVI